MTGQADDPQPEPTPAHPGPPPAQAEPFGAAPEPAPVQPALPQAQPEPTPSQTGRWRGRLAWAAILLSWAWYCHHWPHLKTANEAMRLFFVQAVAETGRPELDSVATRQGKVPVDRSEYGGHVYMDKAPGASLLVLPIYPIWHAIDPQVAGPRLWAFGYLATVVGMALPLLGALALLARALRRHRIGPNAVWVTVLGLATASPLLVYATLLFGHALAAACVLGAFALIAAGGREGIGSRSAWAAGALLGWAGLTDTPVFVLAGLVALYALARALPWPGWQLAQRLRATWPVFAGLAAAVALQLAYNTWVLGHPLRFTYQFKGDRNLAAIMQTGFLGFRVPQPEALAGLLVGSRRGLLYHAPWLAAALAGGWWAVRRRDLPQALRLDCGAALVLGAAYTLFVSGFADWPAGDSPGARHLLPVVALFGFGLAVAWAPPPGVAAPWPWWLRACTAGGLAAGVVLHAPTVATFPYHFDRVDRPVLELAVPLLLRDGFSPSLGHWAGLGNYPSFGLFGVLLAGAWWLALPRRPAPVNWPVVLTACSAVLAWLLLLTSAVPEKPGRAAQVGRYHAWSMLKSGSSGAAPGVHGRVERHR